jgi:hypothetical protein
MMKSQKQAKALQLQLLVKTELEGRQLNKRWNA